MPIRTNRGRAAVYRRVWGWPMRSPTHLAGVVILLVALISGIGIGVSLAFGDSEGGSSAHHPESPPATASSDGDAGPSRDSRPTRLTTPRAEPTTAEPDPEALRVAEKWAQEWTGGSNDITKEQWIDDLRPYTTDEYLPRMRSIDFDDVTAEKITGEPTVTSSYTSSVDVDIPTDGPTLAITVIRTDTGWKVSTYDEGV